MTVRRVLSRFVLLLFFCTAGCWAPPAQRLGPLTPPGAGPLPSLARAVQAVDGATGEPCPLGTLIGRLARYDAVFVGETHLDDTTHRVELALLEGLLEARNGRVVLSLEMFERDVQPTLDRYLAGDIDEAAFLAAARPWGNYRTGYRPLIEAAKRTGIPVVAANTPIALRRAIARGGRNALDRLPEDQRQLLPAEIFPAGDAYWERVDRAVRGHMGGGGSTADRLYSTQNLWDNSMGAACADALTAHPDHLILHVAGGFHVQHHDGTVAQFARRAPAGTTTAVVAIQPVADAAFAQPQLDADRADYLIYADAIARGLSGGTHAALVPFELRYTIDLPEGRPGSDAPLLVWLPDRDWRASDARAFWRAALGDEATIVVVEPPFPQAAADLAIVGAWTRPSLFREDHARLQRGLERIVEYVTRHFAPTVGDRVVIAGNGTGATAVLWTAMYSTWLRAHFVADTPRRDRALQLQGLPEPLELSRRLDLIAPPGAEADAQQKLADYSGLGIETRTTTAGAPHRDTTEAAVRGALGLPTAPPRQHVGASRQRLFLAAVDAPRARHWAEIYARGLERDGAAAVAVVPVEAPPAAAAAGDRAAREAWLEVGADARWSAASFADGKHLPLAPGAFGGTTVVVLPESMAGTERHRWRELEQRDAIKQRSRFARLAVADGAAALPGMLSAIRHRGGRSVLIVPARFCASRAAMRGLQQAAAEFADELDLHWLPGLGAELCGIAQP